jgi:hypothetical protein
LLPELPTGLHDFMAMERGLKEGDVMALMRGKIVKTLGRSCLWAAS